MAGIDCLPAEINVLTLNCWGIPYVSQDRSSRLEEIGRQIVKRNPQPHIVGLQECFSKSDFERIRQETHSILPYSKQYFAGPLGTGLAFLSRWPIEKTSMTRYPLNGSPTALFHGDWYAGKGVAYARVRYGREPDSVIDIFNTHFHAYYPSNEYLCHRVSQAWELAKFLQTTSQHRHGRALVVLLGDLNAEPTSLPYRILKQLVPDMHDTWVQHSSQYKNTPEHDQGIGNARREEASIQSGVTYGSPYNTWMWTRAQRAQYLGRPGTSTSELVSPAEAGREQAARIDYVFANVSPLQPCSTPRYHKETGVDPTTDRLEGDNEAGNSGNICQGSSVWTVKSTKVGMTDRHPTLGCSLSDHFSVEVTLAFEKIEQGILKNHKPSEEPRGSNPRTITGLKEATSSETRIQESQGALIMAKSRHGPDTIELFNKVIGVLDDYSKVLRRCAWWRKARLCAAGIVLAGSLVGVWIVGEPGWARFLLALVGALTSAFAGLDAWSSMSLDPTEKAALEELEWEVRNAKGI
ncbi:Endonuclease/exonuclease/phosphatase [Annulohypoxylon moriforme]|nr:Endonuclease/exonuclease/phosphatase [Annulohypoxylon moriforme]